MRLMAHTAFVAPGALQRLSVVVDARVAIVAIGTVALAATAGNENFAEKMQWTNCRSQTG